MRVELRFHNRRYTQSSLSSADFHCFSDTGRGEERGEADDRLNDRVREKKSGLQSPGRSLINESRPVVESLNTPMPPTHRGWGGQEG